MSGGKFWEDVPLLNCEFLLLLIPGRDQYVTKRALNTMEAVFLQSISWNLLVTRDAYTRTYFELLNIADAQSQAIADAQWQSEQASRQSPARRPLTASEGAKLGLRHDVGELRCGSLLTNAERDSSGRKIWATMPDMRLLKCERSLCDVAVQLVARARATAVIS